MKKEDDAPDDVQEKAPSRTDAIVDAWFAEHIPNSPVSRTTEAYNHILSAIADLKKRLAAA